MTITEAQRAARMQYVGASEVPAILGLDRYKSVGDVWMLKTGRIDGDGPNEATKMGDRLEGTILEMVAEAIESPVFRCANTYQHKQGRLACHPDGMVGLAEARGLPVVEAKSTGLALDWAEGVPERVWWQVQAQMACTESDAAYVGVLIGKHGLKFSHYEVERNPDAAEQILMAVDAFWTQVESDTPPASLPSEDAMRRNHLRKPTKTVDINQDLFDVYDQLAEEFRRVDAGLKQVKKMILASIGDAGIGVAGERMAKVISYGARTLDKTRLSIAHPEIVQAFTVKMPRTRLIINKRGNQDGDDEGDE